MGLRFPEQFNESCFFVTTTFKDWEAFGDIEGVYGQLIKSLKFCVEKYKARISGYVLMPTHIHLLLFIDGKKLSGFMRDFKKYISQKASRDLSPDKTSVWMPRYDRVAIRSLSVFQTKLKYIHDNPVRNGLVKNTEDWIWSSAGDYLGGYDGELPIWKDWR
jgi:REP element-mobilizing transposase RayT